jgi:hypothetical protein
LSTTQNYLFDFSLNAPPASATLNNTLLAKNNVAAIYGVKILQGLSSDGNANGRVYQAFGIGAADYALYNSIGKLLTEDTTVWVNMNGQNFIDQGASATPNGGQRSGMFYGAIPVNPIRLVSGELGTFQFQLNLINQITNLVLTPNVYIKCELLCAMGQASGA